VWALLNAFKFYHCSMKWQDEGTSWRPLFGDQLSAAESTRTEREFAMRYVEPSATKSSRKRARFRPDLGLWVDPSEVWLCLADARRRSYFHFQIICDFLDFALPCDRHCLRLVFSSPMI
jgi:hypothetical protein